MELSDEDTIKLQVPKDLRPFGTKESTDSTSFQKSKNNQAPVEKKTFKKKKKDALYNMYNTVLMTLFFPLLHNLRPQLAALCGNAHSSKSVT